MADALGPNAESVVEVAPTLQRRFRFDPLSAERLVSVGGSYAFGLRLDGIDGSSLRDALMRAGGHPKESEEGVDLVDVGPYAQVPRASAARGGLRARGPRRIHGRTSPFWRSQRTREPPCSATTAD